MLAMALSCSSIQLCTCVINQQFRTKMEATQLEKPTVLGGGIFLQSVRGKEGEGGSDFMYMNVRSSTSLLTLMLTCMRVCCFNHAQPLSK